MNSLIGLKYYEKRNEFNISKVQSSIRVQQLQIRNEHLINCFLKSQLFNNVRIPFLHEKVLNDYTLCLYISANHCRNCVNDVIKYIEDNRQILLTNKLYILTDFEQKSVEYLKAEFKLNSTFITVEFIDSHYLDNKYPCFFIYNKCTSETEMFLFPLKNEPEMMKRYFENVSSKYFAQIKDNSHDEK